MTGQLSLATCCVAVEIFEMGTRNEPERHVTCQPWQTGNSATQTFQLYMSICTACSHVGILAAPHFLSQSLFIFRELYKHLIGIAAH